MGANTHPTTTPDQAQTDTFAVFDNDLVLIKRVEVPRYSQPNVDGVRLNTDKRLALAVHRAIEQSHHPEPIDGEEFMVMTNLEEPMTFAEYEQNPSFDGVWNPEEGEA